MDDSSYRRNFDLDDKNETITIAGKNILKWVKLQSLVANSCKILYILITALRAGKITIFEPKMVIFTACNIKYIQNLRTSQGYIFFILQHLATKLCSFTHSKTLFLAVVLDFVLLALIIL
jgi:hypothetical protein